MLGGANAQLILIPDHLLIKLILLKDGKSCAPDLYVLAGKYLAFSCPVQLTT